MDTFRKWLNKPKSDDKSLLARFYHADRSLTAVTSELDSFDGRAEPDRCSRLVSRLRQGQDKVLAITNLIMEELLGEDRDPRAFRAKFPEEVLQENLAGQLWFGAECLAAGSSIMNREQESKEMRPLAQAVTKSLGNVRNLLRDQCLRNNVPNSKTLHLDINDSTTEQLYESLKIFDRLFAEFELRYVSAMVQVKTKQEYEMQELISVLFSETLQRALKIGLLDQDKVDAFDPALMFSIPRLAIIAGLVVYPYGPLNMDMPSEELSEMFRPFRTILIKIRDLLNTLDKSDLFQLEKSLCTNEDINTRVPVGTSSIEAPCPEQENNDQKSSGSSSSNSNNNNDNSTNCDDNVGGSSSRLNNNSSSMNRSNPISGALTEAQVSVNSTFNKVYKRGQQNAHTGRYKSTRSPSISSVSANSSIPSTPTASPTPSPTPLNSLASTASSAGTSATSTADYTDDDDDGGDEGDTEDDIDDDDAVIGDAHILLTDTDIVSADCASGYLIPNTNFGNLLQPQEVPLTDNFIASEDEFSSQDLQNFVDDEPTTSHQSRHIPQNTETSLNCGSSSEHLSHNYQNDKTSTVSSSNRSCRHHHHSHNHNHGHHHHHHHHHRSSRNSHHHHHSKLKRCHQGGGAGGSNATTGGECSGECSETKAEEKSTATTPTHQDTSSADSRTSSSLSDGDSRDTSLMALHSNGRLRFRSTESLLHRLFVCIAGVADQLQTNFASDLRQILRSVFLMNMSITQEELDIPEKTKESELFEFRASENDVIQESSAGSNQSIYSAEEVNPELDNVFNNINNNNNNSGSGSGSHSSVNSVGSSSRHSVGATIQRGNTIDLGSNEAASNSLRSHVERSRSLGDQEQHENISNNNNNNNNNNASNSRRLSAYITGRRLSASPQNGNATTATNASLRQQRNRNNSTGSNSNSSSAASSSSSSESNSPVSERAAGHSMRIDTNPTNNNNNNNYNTTTTSNTTNSTANMPPQPASRNQLNVTTTNTQTTTPAATRLAPPAWIPDDKAPRCMSCHTQFTAFRRRHHCRNCGGVFCAVCSNASAPLPKYGLIKAVRVCRDCYVREVRVSGGATAGTRGAQITRQAVGTATAGGS